MIQTMPKKELVRQIRRFFKDQDRGISIQHFADLCGVDRVHLIKIFLYQTSPLTEYVQIRVSKAYNAWRDGEVAIMQNRNTSKYVTYRKEAKPRLARTTGLQLVNGEIKIKVGISNQGDYSQQTLGEALNRG